METANQLTPAGTVAAPQSTQPTEAPARQPERSQERIKRTRTGAYDRIGLTAAYVFSGALSALLWYAGAYFTLAALRSFGISTASAWWWLLPAGITAIEIWLMPRTGTRWQAVSFFAVVLAADVLTSWFGVTATMAGRFVPMGAGWTIPAGGTALHIGAIVVSLIFAFGPEKLGRWSVSELLKLWSK